MIAEFNSYMSNIDIDFFKELCLKHGELRHYKKNEFILHEGDACSFFGFILSGVVKYSCTNRTENKLYNVGFSFPNEFIAEMCIRDRHWTGTKRALVELIYALDACGCLHKGTVDIKEIVCYFEYVFDIDLGDFYHTYMELKAKTKDRTGFLSTLKDRLLMRMREQD